MIIQKAKFCQLRTNSLNSFCFHLLVLTNSLSNSFRICFKMFELWFKFNLNSFLICFIFVLYLLLICFRCASKFAYFLVSFLGNLLWFDSGNFSHLSIHFRFAPELIYLIGLKVIRILVSLFGGTSDSEQPLFWLYICSQGSILENER